MATKEQYEFFKGIYDEENARYRNLIDRGKILLSLSSIYIGFLSFSFEKISTSKCDYILFFLSVVLMLLSFGSTILAIGIMKYENPCNSSQLVENMRRNAQQNEDFFDDRIVDYAVATKRNSLKNDIRATRLLYATLFLLVGLIMHAGYFLINAGTK